MPAENVRSTDLNPAENVRNDDVRTADGRVVADELAVDGAPPAANETVSGPVKGTVQPAESTAVAPPSRVRDEVGRTCEHFPPDEDDDTPRETSQPPTSDKVGSFAGAAIVGKEVPKSEVDNPTRSQSPRLNELVDPAQSDEAETPADTQETDKPTVRAQTPPATNPGGGVHVLGVELVGWPVKGSGPATVYEAPATDAPDGDTSRRAEPFERQAYAPSRGSRGDRGDYTVPFPPKAEDTSAKSGKQETYESIYNDGLKRWGDRYGDGTKHEIVRGEYLGKVEAEGFPPGKEAEARTQLAALRYPLHHLKKLKHEFNGKGRESVVASWTGGSEGTFRIYERHHKQTKAEKIATMSHESAHMIDPQEKRNAEFYGGEGNRQEAERYVNDVTQQSLRTGVPLDGYHNRLMQAYAKETAQAQADLDSGAITTEQYQQIVGREQHKLKAETWAILNEMATTKRYALADVERRQHKTIDEQARRSRAAGLAFTPTKLSLLTSEVNKKGIRGRAKPDGGEEAQGVDKHIIRVLEDVNTMQGFRAYTEYLRSKFYSKEEQQRHNRRQHAH